MDEKGGIGDIIISTTYTEKTNCTGPASFSYWFLFSKPVLFYLPDLSEIFYTEPLIHFVEFSGTNGAGFSCNFGLLDL